MTSPAATAGAPPAWGEMRLLDLAVAAGAVFLIVIFSQGWIMPLLGETVDAQAGGIVRLVYLPAYAAGLAILALSLPAAVPILLRQPFLVALLLLSAASMLWSINPGETQRRVIAVGFTSIAGMALAARYSWAQLAEVLAAAFAILCVGSFLLGLTPMGKMSEIFPGAWRGLWLEKNALGNNMALFLPAFMAAALLVPRRAPLWLGMAGLCVLLLILSTSKTSLVAALLAVAAVAFVWIVQRSAILGVLATYAAILVVFAVAGVLAVASGAVFDLLGKDATLTGRTEIWSSIMMEVERRPLLGHGYGTVWTEEGAWGTLAWIVKHAGFRPIHAHSSWMEMLLWIGWTGLVLWALLFAQTIATAIVAAFRHKGALLALPFLVAYGTISITESITLTYNDLRWVVFVAIACRLCLRAT